MGGRPPPLPPRPPTAMLKSHLYFNRQYYVFSKYMIYVRGTLFMMLKTFNFLGKMILDDEDHSLLKAYLNQFRSSLLFLS